MWRNVPEQLLCSPWQVESEEGLRNLKILDSFVVGICRFPDLRHTKETHWRHLSYLDVTRNVSVSQCAGELLRTLFNSSCIDSLANSTCDFGGFAAPLLPNLLVSLLDRLFSSAVAQSASSRCCSVRSKNGSYLFGIFSVQTRFVTSSRT